MEIFYCKLIDGEYCRSASPVLPSMATLGVDDVRICKQFASNIRTYITCDQAEIESKSVTPVDSGDGGSVPS